MLRCFGLGALLLTAPWCNAATHYVATGGDDGNRGTQDSPWTSVGHALSRASAGDEIRIAGGTYSENISFADSKDKITIRGGYDLDGWSLAPAKCVTAIASADGSSCITLEAGTDGTTLSCLVLRGAAKPGAAGLCAKDSTGALTIEGCSLIGNYCGASMPNGNTTVRNSVVAGNSNSGIFRALAPVHKGNVTYHLYNCTVANNGKDGLEYELRDLSWGRPGVVITNCIFSGNRRYGIARASRPGLGGKATIAYCLFHGNAGGWYHEETYPNTVTTTTWGKGILRGYDPCYVDTAKGDFRLKPDSPGVAAGTSLQSAGVVHDIARAPRPDSDTKLWDLGAYECGARGFEYLPESYVTVRGKDGNDGSRKSPFATIAHAVQVTEAGGTVHVGGGVYTQNPVVTAGGRTVRGGYDPGDWTWDPAEHRTVIKSVDGSPCVTLDALPISAATTFSYLTFSGATDENAAGIHAESLLGDRLVIEGCRITGNYHGVTMPYANTTLRCNLIALNRTHGVLRSFSPRHMHGVSYHVHNCTVADNGGHGFVIATDHPIWGAPGMVAVNSIFSGNGGCGISRPGREGWGRSSIEHCLFAKNVRGYLMEAGASTTTLGAGVLAVADPMFIAAGTDYRLQEKSFAAAAGKDMGKEARYDLDGRQRPDAASGKWDIGACEGPGLGSKRPAATYVAATGSDVDGDGTKERPFATLDHAMLCTAATGTVCAAGGRYEMGLLPRLPGQTIRSGYNQATWKADPVHHPTVLACKDGFAPLLIGTRRPHPLERHGVLEYDVTSHIAAPGEYAVVFPADAKYQGVAWVALVQDGKERSRDTHPASATEELAAPSEYTVVVEEFVPGRKYAVQAGFYKSAVPLGDGKVTIREASYELAAGLRGQAQGGLLVYEAKAISDRIIYPRPKLPDACDTTLSVRACRGEYEPASFVVYPTEADVVVEVKVGVLAGDAGALPPGAVDVRAVKRWLQSNHNDIRRGPSRLLLPELLLHDDSLVKQETSENYVKLKYPDGKSSWLHVSSNKKPEAGEVEYYSAENAPISDAPSLQPVSIRRCTAKQFWITVHVPEDAKPGTYRGTIEVTARPGGTATLSLDVEVLPFELAANPLESSLYFHWTWSHHFDAIDRALVASPLREGQAIRASRNVDEKFPVGNVCDGDFSSAWAVERAAAEEWVEIDLGKEYLVGGVCLHGDGKINHYQVKVKKGNGWQIALDDAGFRGYVDTTFTPVRGRVFRLCILKTDGRSRLREFQLCAEMPPEKRYEFSGSGSSHFSKRTLQQYRAELENLLAHGVDNPSIGVRADLLPLVLRMRKEVGMKNEMLYCLSLPSKLTRTEDVKRIIAIAESFGCRGVHFYGPDEGVGKHLASYREVYKRIHAAGGKVITAGYPGKNFELVGDLQDVLVCFGRLNPAEAAKWHGNGHRIFSYFNPQAGIERPALYRRNYGIDLLRAGYDGAMTYIYYQSWNDFCLGLYRPHNFVYPTIDGVIDTIQWEGYREGIDDIRYYTTLQKAIAESERLELVDVKPARTFLERINTNGDLDAVRAKMIDWILELRAGAP